MTLTEKLLPQFLLIVPLTPFPLGNFQPWEWELDEDNYWKPCTGAGTALAVNGPFLSAWLGLDHSPSLLLHWSEPTSIWWFPSAPQVWNFFFTSGRNRVTANCGNWSQQPREENTRSIIYTSVPRTRLQNKTWIEQQRGRFTADTQQNEWKKTWICCEVNSSALPGWTLFAHSTNLLSSGWPCPREAE